MRLQRGDWQCETSISMPDWPLLLDESMSTVQIVRLDGWLLMSTQLRHHICCGWSSFESAQELDVVTKTRRIWIAIGSCGECSYAKVGRSAPATIWAFYEVLCEGVAVF